MIYPPLSRSETALLAELDRRHLARLTTADARQLIGTSGHRVVSNMARKGLLHRIRRGIYLVQPFRSIARPWGLSALAAVEQALENESHYIGGVAAFTLHRMTEQMYSSVIDVYMVARRRSAVIANAHVNFHVVPASTIELGITAVQIEGVDVRVSDPERTSLDALDRPAAVGGLRQGVSMVDHALGRVNVPRLVTYALEVSPLSTLQRLGVLLERRGTAEAELQRLSDRVQGTSNKPSMVPGSRRGLLHPRWHIIENDTIERSHPW